MNRELMQAVRELLAPKPLTPGGAAFLLRHDFTPTPVIGEIEPILELLTGQGYARKIGRGRFGPEYVLSEKAQRAALPDDRWTAMIPDPHPPANCGPLNMGSLPPGMACPTCGIVPDAGWD